MWTPEGARVLGVTENNEHASC